MGTHLAFILYYAPWGGGKLFISCTFEGRLNVIERGVKLKAKNYQAHEVKGHASKDQKQMPAFSM